MPRLPTRALALAALAASLAIVAVAPARASGAGGFDSELPAGYDINPKHQSNWEPTVAVDPKNPNRVYQLITGINAQACKGNCPGTSVLFRRSTDGGASFSPESFVCGAACKTIGWQYDPQIQVANDADENPCGCGTIYVAFLDQYDPGVQLFTSHDGGDTWSPPVTMNGGLKYMDKPILVISPSGRDVYVAFNHKFDNMVVASHDNGHSFLPPQKVNDDDQLWWYANSGAIAPNGDVYFALDGEASLSGHMDDFDGSAKVALLRRTPSDTEPCANPTLTSFGVPPPPRRPAPCRGAIRTTSRRPGRSRSMGAGNGSSPKASKKAERAEVPLRPDLGRRGELQHPSDPGERRGGLQRAADRQRRPQPGGLPPRLAGRPDGPLQHLVCADDGLRGQLGVGRSALWTSGRLLRTRTRLATRSPTVTTSGSRSARRASPT